MVLRRTWLMTAWCKRPPVRGSNGDNYEPSVKLGTDEPQQKSKAIIVRWARIHGARPRRQMVRASGTKAASQVDKDGAVAGCSIGGEEATTIEYAVAVGRWKWIWWGAEQVPRWQDCKEASTIRNNNNQAMSQPEPGAHFEPRLKLKHGANPRANTSIKKSGRLYRGRQRRFLGHLLEQGSLTSDDQRQATTARLQVK